VWIPIDPIPNITCEAWAKAPQAPEIQNTKFLKKTVRQISLDLIYVMSTIISHLGNQYGGKSFGSFCNPAALKRSKLENTF
jgi:hypothetical protein